MRSTFTYDEVIARIIKRKMSSEGIDNEAQAIRELILDGERYSRLSDRGYIPEKVALKTLFYLKRIAEHGRGESFISNIERDFENYYQGLVKKIDASPGDVDSVLSQEKAAYKGGK